MVPAFMHYEIRGIRVKGRANDGDTIHVSKFKVLLDGHIVRRSIRKKALTSKGFLRVRILGIDAPETHYPGTRTCNGTRKKGVKILPQFLGDAATVFTDKLLPHGKRVILETDEDRGPDSFYDKYGRILVYAWTSRGNWKKDKLVNLELVRRGLALPYQIWPNIRHFAEISNASANAMKKEKGVYGNLTNKIIPFSKLKSSKKLNEPFVYRKVVDGKLCNVNPLSLLHRWVFDVQNRKSYPPKEYFRVPIPYRIYYE